jgi:hypothetical protein
MRLAALLLLGLLPAHAAQAEPFVFGSAASLRSLSNGLLSLPDGRVVDPATLAAAGDRLALDDASFIALDLGPAATVFADAAGNPWSVAAFLDDTEGVKLRAPGAGAFVDFVSSGDLPAALAALGALAFRQDCPRGVACPQRESIDGVFADGFE